MSTAGRRRRLRAAATASFCAAAVLGLLPTPSGADEPTVVGWWYRDVPLSDAEPQGAAVHAQAVGAPVRATLAERAAGPTQVPPPPTIPPLPVPTVPPDVTVPDPGGNVPTPTAAPEGGLLVASDATGVRGIAAMRFDAPDAGGATVSLRIAPGSTPSPAIRACPALSDWLPGPDQEWAARPAHDCDRISISSTLSEDGTTLTWALPDTFRRPDAAVYDVLLVPAGGDGTPFQVAFEKPGADAFTVTSPRPDEEVLPDLPLPEDLPPPAAAFSPDGYDFSAPYADLAGPELVDAAPASQVGPADGASGPLGQLADALENPTTRRIATALLVALGAYTYWQSNQAEQRTPRLLGALSGPSTLVADAVLRPTAVHPRGIGRFVRQRSGPPPRL